MRTPVPRVVRNDWSTIPVPDLAGWRPSSTVSVIVPAYRCQPTLDLTLAALARQTYPSGLLEVVVVDDGSDPPLALPVARPSNTRLLRVPDHDAGWGRANALRLGALHSNGAILHWLDADMLPFPDHVAAQARWHEAVPYAVTIGYKRFVEPPWPDTAAVLSHWERGAADQLFTGGQPHAYVEETIDRSGGLRRADHLAFMAHVGATATVRRELYEAAGGFDPRLRLGEDTDFGYRLAAAGAVFVPEPAARSWHLGPSHVMRGADPIRRYNRPHLADRMPYPRWLRDVGGSAWSVPLVSAVVDVAGQPLERVRAAVDALLRGAERDLRVSLVGPWDQLTDDRVRPLADPLLEARLIAQSYRGDPRVSLVTEPPDDAFPAAYLLELPAHHGLARLALARLVDLADTAQVGVVRVEPPAGGGPATVLWRTAALRRARLVRAPGESMLDAVASVYGRRDLAAAAAGVVDLTAFPPEALAGGVPDLGDPALRPGRWLPGSVRVAGVRSLGRAALVVAANTARRLSARWSAS